MSTLHKCSKTGNWRITWYETDGRRPSKTLKDADDKPTKSKRRARELQRQFDDKLRDKAVGRTVGGVTGRIDHYKGLYLDQGVTAKDKARARAGLEALGSYRKLSADTLTPEHLERVKERLIVEGKARVTINHYLAEIKRFYKWMARRRIVSPEVYAALALVEGVRKGAAAVNDGRDVKPVRMAHIDAVKPLLPMPVRAMVEIQLLTGASSGQLVELRPADVDRTGDVWTSTSFRKQTLVTVHYGIQAQRVLRPLIARVRHDQYIFSYDGGEHTYTSASYRRAIERAIERVNKKRPKKKRIPRWTPHMLRHTAATLVREKYGLEAAQVYLGHSTLTATQIYAEANAKLAEKIAKEMG